MARNLDASGSRAQMTARRGCAGLRRRLFGWALVFAAAWGVGTFFLSDLPYSAFYKFPLARLMKEHVDRRSSAFQFFSSPSALRKGAAAAAATLLDGTMRHDSNFVDTCIAVLRDDREYFLPTMHSLLKAMRGSERSNVHLVVVDTSAQHPQVKSSSASNSTAHDLDLVRPFVDSIIDAVPAAPSHGDPEAGADQHDSERHHSWERKELQDYATALRYCDRTMKKRHSMTIVLEDDIVVSEGFLAYLNALCDEHHCLDEPLGTVKLFTTEYYWGWETKETAWLIETGLAVSMLSACILLFGAALCHQRRLADKKRRANMRDQMSLFVFSTKTKTGFQHMQLAMSRLGGCQSLMVHASMAGLFFTCTLLAIGRQTVFPPYIGRDGIWQFPGKTIDSNSVATVFDTRRVRNLATIMDIESRRSDVSYLNPINAGTSPFLPVDLLIDNWCKRRLNQMYVVPSLAQQSASGHHQLQN